MFCFVFRGTPPVDLFLCWLTVYPEFSKKLFLCLFVEKEDKKVNGTNHGASSKSDDKRERREGEEANHNDKKSVKTGSLFNLL